MGAKLRKHFKPVGIVLAMFFICMTVMTAFVFAPKIDKSNSIGNNIQTSNAAAIPADNTTLAVGGSHSLVIDEAGRLWAWGENTTDGRLGIGNTENQTSPQLVGGDDATHLARRYKAVAAGTNHSLAIDTDGYLWAWGLATNGRLGLGGTSSSPTGATDNLPTQVGMAKWKAISAGDTHSLAIDENDDLYAWGSQADGRLGNGTTSTTTSIVAPAKIGTAKWIAINAGTNHSLGVQSGGQLYAWGNPGTSNQQNKLGEGNSTTVRNTPQSISTNGTSYTAVSAAAAFSHGIRTVSGQQQLFGMGTGTNLGNNSNSNTPTRINTGTISTNGGQVQAIAARETHTLAIDTSGYLHAWGQNGNSRLGDNTVTARTSPVRVGTSGTVARDQTYTAVGAGTTHSVAVASDDSVWAWGNPAAGRVGHGSTSAAANVPVKIMSRIPSVTVTLDAGNGGSVNPSTITAQYNRTYGTLDGAVRPLPTPTHSTATFSGWFTHPVGGVQVTDDTTVADLENHILYAHWEIASVDVSVTFHSNDGTNGIKTQNLIGVDLPHNFTLEQNSFSRPGYTFSKWNTNPSGTTGTSYNNGDTATITSESGLVLYARWTGNTYTIEFNNNNGSGTISPQSRINGTAEALPASTPFTRAGYTFNGWNTQANGGGTSYANLESFAEAPGAPPASDGNSKYTLYAQWKGNTYSFSFNRNGGTGTMSNQTNRTYGTASAITTNTFTRSGYKFTGWATSATGSVVFTNGQSVSDFGTSGITPPANNNPVIALHAVWEGLTYTISYNANNGGGLIPPQQAVYGESVTLSTNNTSINRPGWTFIGWNTSANGGGTDYADGATFTTPNPWTPTADGQTFTLFAQWSKNLVIKVRFEPNGGTGNAWTYTDEGAQVNLPQNNFTRDSNAYTFMGWAYSQTATVADFVDKASFTITEDFDVVLYAVWRKHPVITFNPNNGDATFDRVTDTGGNCTAPNGTGFTPVPNRTFIGWAHTSTATNFDFAPGATINRSTDGTLYGVWRENWKVIFNAGTGGSGSMDSIYSDTNGNVTIPAPHSSFTRTDHSFDYWYTNANGTGGTRYNVGQNVTGLTANLNLFIIWRQHPLVSFNPNTGSGTMAGQRVDKDGKLVLPNSTFTPPAGNSFAGWNTAANGSGTQYAAGDTITTAANITLYARWSLNWVITYDGNGSTGGSTDNTIASAEGNATVRVNGFSRDGYTFNRWNTAANGSGINYNENQSVIGLTANLNLFAIWTEHKKVTFYGNGANATPTMSSQYARDLAGNITLKANEFVREGWTFIGWATSNGATTVGTIGGIALEPGASIVISADTSLYAVWRMNPLTVVYNKNHNDATGSMTNSATNNAGFVTLRVNTFTRAGYTFKGWSTVQGATTVGQVDGVTLNDGANVTFAFTLSNIVLYAVWQANPIIIFNSNGGSGTIADLPTESLTGQIQKLTKNTFTRDGHTFAGWSLTQHNPTQYSGSSNPNVEFVDEGSATVGTGVTVTLYAVWREHWQVNFNANGGTGTTMLRTDTNGFLTLPTLAQATNFGISRGDHTVVGWSRTQQAVGTAPQYQLGEALVQFTGNTAIYAVWRLHPLITFHANGAAGTTPTAMRVDTNGRVNLPTPSGLVAPPDTTFVGWTDEFVASPGIMVPKYGHGTSGVSAGPFTGDTLLYAVWSQNPVLVFHGNAPGVIGSMAPQTTTNINGYVLTLNLNTFKRETANGVQTHSFDGWVTVGNGDGGGTGQSYSNGQGPIEFNPSGNTANVVFNLYAKWRAHPVISFDRNGGTAGTMSPDYADTNGDFVLPAATYTRGDARGETHSFIGWSRTNGATAVQSGHEAGQTIRLTSNVTLYAVWRQHPIISFERVTSQGGSGTMGSLPVNAAGELALPESTFTPPTDRSFGGWSRSQDGSSPMSPGFLFVVPNTPLAVTLYAVWTDNPIVSFNGNGHTGGSTASQATNAQGHLASLRENGFIKTGHTFREWNTQANGQGISYLPGNPISGVPGTGCILYAIWDAHWTVTFDGNGSTSGNMAIQYADDLQGNIAALNNNTFRRDPTHTFMGWATYQGGPVAYANQATLKIGISINLWAVWREHNRVYFHANGGTGEIAMRNTQSNGDLTLPTGDGFTRENHTFIGWSRTWGSTIVDTGHLANQTPNFTNFETTLYAVWREHSQIMFNGNHSGEGAGYMPNIYANSNGSATLPVNEFTYPNYTWVSWNTRADGLGESYTVTIPVGGVSDYETLILYAQWHGNYRISFNTNGGVGTMPTQYANTSTGTASMTLNPNTFTRVNHSFRGWGTTEGTTTVVHNDGATINISSNVTLYAVWRTHPLISFNANGGDGTTPDMYANATGDLILPANGFNRLGWSFVGWDDVAGSTSPKWEPGDLVNYGTAHGTTSTLFAIWHKNLTINITFLPNADDATGEMDIFYAEGTPTSVSAQLPEAGFERFGFSIIGWSLAADDETIEYVTLDTLTFDTNFVAVLYAVWGKNITIDIRFNANEGEGSMAAIHAMGTTEGASITLSDVAFTRSGFIFKGWAFAADGELVYEDRAVISVTEDFDGTLYAVWVEELIVRVVLNPNGGNGDVIMRSFEENFTLRNIRFKRPGFAFKGWSLTPDGDVDFAPNHRFEITGNTTFELYAVWEQHTFDFGTFMMIAIIIVGLGAVIVLMIAKSAN